ncbi:MAG: hypothetical protein E4G96_01515, partial [Chrysiogenales bacterium]
MKKTLIVIAALAIGLFGFIAYSGIFHTVTVSEKAIGPFTMVLKAHKGSYYGTGDVFKEVAKSLNAFIDPEKLLAVGIYYDDPAKVKAEELRSECGFILGRDDLTKIVSLRKSFIIKAFPKTTCMVGEFPIKTPLSYMIGPSRAYPKLSEYIQEK